MKLGEVGGRIAKVGTKAARQQLPIEHEGIVAQGSGTGLRPGDDAARHGGAIDGADLRQLDAHAPFIDGADQDEIAGGGQVCEEIECRRPT